MLRPSLDWAKPRIVRDANIKLRRSYRQRKAAASGNKVPEAIDRQTGTVI